MATGRLAGADKNDVAVNNAVSDGVTVDATLAVFVFKYVSVAGFTPPTGASTFVCGTGAEICIPGPDAMDVESWNVEEAASTFI